MSFHFFFNGLQRNFLNFILILEMKTVEASIFFLCQIVMKFPIKLTCCYLYLLVVLVSSVAMTAVYIA